MISFFLYVSTTSFTLSSSCELNEKKERGGTEKKEKKTVKKGKKMGNLCLPTLENVKSEVNDEKLARMRKTLNPMHGNKEVNLYPNECSF